MSMMDEQRDLLAKVDPLIADRAAVVLREKLRYLDHLSFARLMDEHPDNWFDFTPLGWHFDGGMKLRNTLRTAGFGETKLGVNNLDNIYLALLERAVHYERKRP